MIGELLHLSQKCEDQEAEVERLKKQLGIAMAVIEHIGEHSYDYQSYTKEMLEKIKEAADGK